MVPPQSNKLDIPIRWSRWPSFLLGLAALLAAAVLAGALSLALAHLGLDAALLLILAGGLWGGAFFLSLPWQRGAIRRRETRLPGLRLAQLRLTAPLGNGEVRHFQLDEPYSLQFGWLDTSASSGGGPMSKTRFLLTYALLAQGGQELVLLAEDSVEAAGRAGWPNQPATRGTGPELRLWADDLVRLVEALRARAVALP